MTKHTGIYLDLDTIIDTRLNLLYAIDDKLADKVVKSDKWKNRFVDSFEYISYRVFKNLYKKRNRSLLSTPRVTKVIELLSELTIKIRHRNINFGQSGNVIVYLNIFPYDIDIMEIDMLLNGISQSLPSHVEIKIIKESYITPEWISNNVIVVLMYDGLEWIEKNTANKNLIKINLPEVLMITPILTYPKHGVIKKPPSDKELLNITETLLPIIRVEFASIDIFSS